MGAAKKLGKKVGNVMTLGLADDIKGGWDSLRGKDAANAAEDAAYAQGKAAEQGIALQRETRDLLRADQAPYKGLGDRAINGLEFLTHWGEVGSPNVDVLSYLNNRQTIDPNSAFSQGDEQYKFLVGEQNKAIEESSAAKGKLNSGGTLAEIARNTAGNAAQYSNNRFNQLMNLRQNNFSENMQNAGLASTLRDQLLRERLSLQNNKYNQLRDLVGIGQNAAALQGSASSNATNAISQLLGDKANAFAAGQIGAANAKAQGLNNLIQGGLSAYGISKVG